LVQVVPDATMMVPGYEHQTPECLACHEIERRLVFARKPSPGTTTSPSARQDENRNFPPDEGGEPSPVIAPTPSASVRRDDDRRSPQREVREPSPAIAPISSAAQQRAPASPQNEGGAASSTWECAVEKLRKRQVDLIERAKLAKTTDAYRPPPPAKQIFQARTPNRADGESWPQNRERRSVVAGQAMAQVVERLRQGAPRDKPEVRQFDDFWDNLSLSHSLPAPAWKSPARLPELAQSTSLVPIDVGEARSLCARAIAMLRGRIAMLRGRDVSTVQPETSDILNGRGYNANNRRGNAPL
jgi:hypothetical protein